MVKTVKCPTCEKAVEWTDENPWRPFCSERCKLIDLGEWASESHRIAGDNVDDFSLSNQGEKQNYSD
ncbi:DNA gyrase inhibitor YacG [Kaarinaea lacus]